MLMYPEMVDWRLGWKPGLAERLAKQRRLPHFILPDGSVRFDWTEIESLIVRVQATEIGPIKEGRNRA